MTDNTAPYAGQKLSRDDVLRIVAEAREAGTRADLRYANLRAANLRSADLGSADLRYANLGSANLGSADLRSADLRSANLRYANLRYANLGSADLRSAALRSADLRYADLVGTTCLSVTGLPSGPAILAPLPAGWRVTVGCWSGTVEALRDLIAGDDDWPEAEGDQITARRPMLAALADMCDAWIADKTNILAHVQAEWTPEGERRGRNDPGRDQSAHTPGCAEGGDR